MKTLSFAESLLRFGRVSTGAEVADLKARLWARSMESIADRPEPRRAVDPKAGRATMRAMKFNLPKGKT